MLRLDSFLSSIAAIKKKIDPKSETKTSLKYSHFAKNIDIRRLIKYFMSENYIKAVKPNRRNNCRALMIVIKLS